MLHIFFEILYNFEKIPSTAKFLNEDHIVFNNFQNKLLLRNEEAICKFPVKDLYGP